MRIGHLLLLLFSFLWASTNSQVQAIYVNDGASGANNGSSWEDAYTDLQGALAIAEEGSEIWVAEGIYRPAEPDGSREGSFVIEKNLKLYGGFADMESSLEERGDPADFPTILSGDLNGDDFELIT